MGRNLGTDGRLGPRQSGLKNIPGRNMYPSSRVSGIGLKIRGKISFLRAQVLRVRWGPKSQSM